LAVKNSLHHRSAAVCSYDIFRPSLYVLLQHFVLLSGKFHYNILDPEPNVPAASRAMAIVDHQSVKMSLNSSKLDFDVVSTSIDIQNDELCLEGSTKEVG
jgi:hypothetical protein